MCLCTCMCVCVCVCVCECVYPCICMCTWGNYMRNETQVVSSYKESCNNKPMYGYTLPNLSPSPNLYKVQSVYNNDIAS